jgi:long-chain fatty acid transport protein
MALRRIASSLLVGGALVVAATQADAGGFAVREQSAYGQGTSYAGIAAGGALSSMFWNPATMTQTPGFAVEGDFAGIMPVASQTPLPGSTLFALGGVSNSAERALVPSFYASYQINPDFWIGMSFNAPYGLSVGFPDIWAGRNYAENTSLRTYTATPMLAWRINEMISVGLGVQIQYGEADLNRGLVLPPATLLTTNLSGNGWAWGVTAGVTVKPTAGTTIGLGWRSQMDQKIDGTFNVPAVIPGSTPGDVSTKLKLPDIVSFGVRQVITPQWTLLGTVEWSNWSRIGTSAINAGGGPALVAGVPVTIPFEYKDGWLFSLGAEYQWSPTIAVRGGIGYEISPITDSVRIPLLPDNDRLWLSAGLTAAITNTLKLDVAYSHLFVRDANVNVGPGNPSFNPLLGTYFGTVDSHIDIVTVALRWTPWEPPTPVRTSLPVK